MSLMRVGSCQRFCGRCCGTKGFVGHPNYEQYKDEWKHPPFPGLTSQGTCAAFQWVNGLATCTMYETRPQICKDFPDRPSEISTIPECGFSFIPRPRPVLKKPTLEPHKVMAAQEEWPFFTVKKRIDSRRGTVWVELDHVPKLKTLEHQRRFLEEMRRLEWKCYHQGMRGWMAGIDDENNLFQRTVFGYGGDPYARTQDGYVWFRYPVSEKPRNTIPNIRAITMQGRAYDRISKYIVPA